MEQFKTKKPSRFNTWCAMATFRLCDAEIEEQHHCNLIQGKAAAVNSSAVMSRSIRCLTKLSEC